MFRVKKLTFISLTLRKNMNKKTYLPYLIGKKSFLYNEIFLNYLGF